MPGAPPVWLSAGDAVLPCGDAHSLGGRDPANTVHVGEPLPRRPGTDGPGRRAWRRWRGGRHCLRLLQCDEALFQPLMRHLPAVADVNPASDGDGGWSARSATRSRRRAGRGRSGRWCRRLAELMFVEILRSHLRDLSPDQVGWFAAFKDPAAGAALSRVHAAPDGALSLDSLAAPSKRLAHRAYRAVRPFPRPAAHALRGAPSAPTRRPADEDRRRADQGDRRARRGVRGGTVELGAFKRHFASPPGEWRRRQAPYSAASLVSASGNSRSKRPSA